jgi:hypothetical protein
MFVALGFFLALPLFNYIKERVVKVGTQRDGQFSSKKEGDSTEMGQRAFFQAFHAL